MGIYSTYPLILLWNHDKSIKSTLEGLNGLESSVNEFTKKNKKINSKINNKGPKIKYQNPDAWRVYPFKKKTDDH